MTQQELADRIGVTRQTVNAIELGQVLAVARGRVSDRRGLQGAARSGLPVRKAKEVSDVTSSDTTSTTPGPGPTGTSSPQWPSRRWRGPLTSLHWTRLAIVAAVLSVWGLAGAFIIHGPLRFNRPVALPTRTVPALRRRPRARCRCGLRAIGVDGPAVPASRERRRARSLLRLLRHRGQHAGSDTRERARRRS